MCEVIVMDKTLKIGKNYILVVDTESNTTTGAMTSIQYANVFEYVKPYPIEYKDAKLIRCTSTADGMYKFHDDLLKTYKDGDSFIIYCHNLKWDITFWLNWLMKDLHYTFTTDKKFGDNQFTTLITTLGQVFNISYKYKGLTIRIQDSLKIIPFGLGEAGSKKAYDTKFKKIKDEDYDGVLSDEYCLHDVLCLSELVSIQLAEGINPRTTMSLASWCLKDFKNKIFNSELGDIYRKHLKDTAETEEIFKKRNNAQYCYRYFFPQIDHLAYFKTDTSDFNAISLDSYCRAAYRGGLTYCNPENANTIYISRWFYEKNKCSKAIQDIIKSGNYKIVNYISHLDVHSLYPSKCLYGYKNYTTLPVGKPTLIKGCPSAYTIQCVKENKAHFIIRFKCKFNIKPDKYPSIQLKATYFQPNEWLNTSAVEVDGVPYNQSVMITLTDVEFFDFLERYNVEDLFIIDYMYFNRVLPCKTIFNSYMGYYYKEKSNTSKSNFVKYQSVKSKLNNLTGKFGTSTIAGIKEPFIDTDGAVRLRNKKVGSDNNLLTKNSEYTPIIAFITAYGRLTLLDEMDKAGNDYITGDTDSLFVASEERFVPTLGITDSDLNTFDEEHSPEEIAMFCASRQKTYIMYIVKEGKIKMILKIAGMTDKQKEKFTKESANPILDFSNENVKVKGGKKIKEATPEGAVLVDTDFKMTPEVKKNIKKETVDKATDRRIESEIKLIKTPEDLEYKLLYDMEYRKRCINNYLKLEREGKLCRQTIAEAVGVDFHCVPEVMLIIMRNM